MGLYLGSTKINSLNPTYLSVETQVPQNVAGITIDNMFSYDESTGTLSKSSSGNLVCNAKKISDYGINYLFYRYTNLSSVSFSSLTSVGQGGMECVFYNSTELSFVSFPLLITIGYGGMYKAFYNCSNISSVSFPKLSSIGQFGFAENIRLKEIYLPKVASIAYSNVFSYCDSLTAFHFAAENESTITADTYYSTLWGRGAGAATVYFDA